jgi:anti-anti-sigma regulatory factor
MTEPEPPDAVVCDVGGLTRPDAVTIDALARLGLRARRGGRELHLRDPSPALCELIDLCGLAAVLRVEARRQAEEGEQPLRVEERVEMGDPPV